MTKFSTIAEATEYVETILGEFASDYDCEAIAREVTDWQDGQLVLSVDDDELWAIVMSSDEANAEDADRYAL